MKLRLFLVAVVSALALTLMVMPHKAAAGSLEVTPTSHGFYCGATGNDIPQVVEGSPGDSGKISNFVVPASLQGQTVTVNAQITNDSSTHPGNQIILTSTSGQVLLDDFEGSANKVTTASGQLTLGSTVDATLKLGSDGYYNGAGPLVLSVTCPASTPTLVCEANTIDLFPTVVKGSAGSVTLLKTIAVPANLNGSTVTVAAQTTNNGSTHPGSQLIIASSGSPLTLDDVEAYDGKVTSTNGNLSLGNTIIISVKLGPDGVFSGAGEIAMNVTCPVTPPTGGRGGGTTTTDTTPQVKAVPTVVNTGEGGAQTMNPTAIVGLIGSLVALLFGLRRLASKQTK